MKLSELFDIRYGVNLELNKLQITSNREGINFVARTCNNNGVVCRVAPIDIKPNSAGTLSCAAGGSVLSTFVQREPYYSGRDLYVLKPKIPMSLAERFYYAHLISANKYKYNYGRQANKTLKDIELPDDLPIWLSSFTLKPFQEMVETQNLNIASFGNMPNWREFNLVDLFTFKRGERLTKEDRVSGNTPLVTAGGEHLGVKDFILNETQKRFNNAITIDMFCNSYTHVQEFCCDDNILVLSPKRQISKYAMLFINTVIQKDKYRYQYGRQYRQKNLKNHTVKLPATTKGAPDWQFMEDYIKSLPYADRI